MILSSTFASVLSWIFVILLIGFCAFELIGLGRDIFLKIKTNKKKSQNGKGVN